MKKYSISELKKKKMKTELSKNRLTQEFGQMDIKKKLDHSFSLVSNSCLTTNFAFK